ncbi:MAG: hypothetical protein K2Y23_03485 [Cyanobacteria bacterium]|nr:hypothetical protein [Cyanobacteriota bacterium]
MDRRHFIRFVSAAIGAASIARPRGVTAQAGNPKVYFFGMFLIDNIGAPTIRVPQLDGMEQHRSFMAASDATISALGGTVITLNQQNGLQLIHRDFTLARFPKAMPLQQGLSLSGGAGPVLVQQTLLDRLPSLSVLSARAGGGQRTVAMPPGSLDIALSNGQLRLPQTPSRSAGADPAVSWQIAVNGVNAGSPMPLTDLCVFESAGPALTVTIGGKNATLNASEDIWIFNIPLVKGVDKTPKEIEHIAEWALLLNPPLAAGTLKATTTFPLVLVNSGAPFNHPNLSLPGVRARALAYFAKMNPTVSSAGIPPDSDLCMQFRS